MSRYDDIVDTQWPPEGSKPRMLMEERAKIFMPFAALKAEINGTEEDKKKAATDAALNSPPDRLELPT